MSALQPIGFGFDKAWFLGEDKTLRFYVGTGEAVEVTERAVKNATTILVRPLLEPIASGAKVRFRPHGKNVAGVVATLSAAAAFGDTSLAVSALPGAVQTGFRGYAMEDITSWTLAWSLREGAYESAPALIAKATPSGSGINIFDGPNAIVDVAIADDDTVNSGTGALLLQPGTYQHALKRTNSGAETVLAFGPARLQLPSAR